MANPSTWSPIDRGQRYNGRGVRPPWSVLIFDCIKRIWVLTYCKRWARRYSKPFRTYFWHWNPHNHQKSIQSRSDLICPSTSSWSISKFYAFLGNRWHRCLWLRCILRLKLLLSCFRWGNNCLCILALHDHRRSGGGSEGLLHRRSWSRTDIARLRPWSGRCWLWFGLCTSHGLFCHLQSNIPWCLHGSYSSCPQTRVSWSIWRDWPSKIHSYFWVPAKKVQELKRTWSACLVGK